MWSALAAVAAVIIAVIAPLYKIGTNSHLRALAEKRPNSWLYLYIAFFDRAFAALLNATLLRPVQAEHAPATQISDAVAESDAYPVKHRTFLDVQHAIRIVIDPKVRIPSHVWFLLTPQAQLVWIIVSTIVLYCLVYVVLADFDLFRFSVGLGVILNVALAGSLIAIIAEKGPFNVAMKLRMNPQVNLIITSKTLYVHSAWLPGTVIANKGTSFVASDGKFMSQITVVTARKPNPTVIFSYPAFLQQFFNSEGSLATIVDRLNRLLAVAQKMEAIQIEAETTPAPEMVPTPAS
jgi:hypothetical protein